MMNEPSPDHSQGQGDIELAYHEAGHAVAHFVDKHVVTYVTIEPTGPDSDDEGLESGPHTTCENCPFYAQSLDEIPEKDTALRRLLAGALAAKIRTGEYNWNQAERDLRAATELVCWFSPGDRYTAKQIGLLIQAGIDTLDWLNEPDTWLLVDAVAGALLKHRTLTKDQFATVIRNVTAGCV